MLSKDWLLNGKGDKYSSALFFKEEEGEYKRKDEFGAQILHTPQCSFGILPVINLSAGTDKITIDNISEYLPMPYAQKKDIIIIVHGEDFIPVYAPGCYLHMRKIDEWTKFLEFGKNYLIELTDGRCILKKVNKSDKPGKYTLNLVNREDGEQDISLKRISKIYMVIAKYEKLVL